MSTDIHVNCSGSLFSSLQYELINNKKLQEGFLLGDIKKFTSHSISDSEIHNENMNVVINISGYIPCPKMGSFYSGSGRVDFQYLKSYVGNNMKRTVGWYHSRKFSESIFLKEMRIHEQLREEMSHTDRHFLFALFSRIQPADSGTMDVSYKFQIMLNNNEFEGVPLKIVNMNDTSSSQYLRNNPSSSLYNSRSLDTIVSTLRNLEPGVKEAEQLHLGLLNQLRSLLPKYASIQEQHHIAARFVAKLREFCYSCEITPDFQPNITKECDFDLMNLEASPKLKTRQVNGSALKDSNYKKIENTSKSLNKADPFGFIEKEMEKHQENGASKRKVSRTKKNDEKLSTKEENESDTNLNKIKNKSVVVKKKLGDGESSPIQNSTERTRQNCASSSPARKSPKEINTKKQNSTLPKAKPTLGMKMNSLDETSSPLSVRHRSRSTGINNKSKSKDTEAWTDNKLCAGDSPEY